MTVPLTPNPLIPLKLSRRAALLRVVVAVGASLVNALGVLTKMKHAPRKSLGQSLAYGCFNVAGEEWSLDECRPMRNPLIFLREAVARGDSV